ncbi:hypothetical protein, partial [Pantoea sp.]|uniref:hypothetical protein n=1 Tax=Pantoea sp. TaxID=69393 RepID=UPI00257EA0C2
SNEGTARSAAWRLPEAGIVKGLASPLTRTPAAALLKLPAAWRAEPAQSVCSADIKNPFKHQGNLISNQQKRS